jgi:thiosulfate reductase cytochrome b subunit
VWFVASLINGHLRRDIIPTAKDIKSLPSDVAEHARLKFRHTRQYNVLQKLSYGVVLLILFPLIVLTGLSMSPGMNAAWPWLIEIFGGRQTARTIHFITMALLVIFFIVHIVMVLLAGPLNTMRSMITGKYRIDPETEGEK